MKVTMINDCAYVGETLLKYLPNSIEKHHIRRTRSLWSKTIGISYQILRTRGNIYHINYLLQDCYIALKLGKRPAIGHAHGSDLRTSLNHFAWGKIVEYNLRNCEKILVSTPDVLEQAEAFGEDVEYLPNPVDIELFHPKSTEETKEEGTIRVLIASKNDWNLKGTDLAVRALSEIQDEVIVSLIRYGKDLGKTLKLARTLNLDIQVLPKIHHQEMIRYYWRNDVVIDQFPQSGTIGNVGIEAIASGRPVVTYIKSGLSDYRDFPSLDIDTEEKIIDAVLSTRDSRIWELQFEYVKSHHAPDKIAQRLLQVYEDVL
jgi:glycosyltransferase involved in cell wall biosynthesis